ncbi:MAG: TonB-dependent receptor [Lysobacteraceae bacterium]
MSRCPVPAPLAAALLLALSAASVHAAEAAAPEPQTLDVIEVNAKAPRHATAAETATRTSTPLRDVPQAVSAVTRQELDERDVRSLNQALETVPGVSLTMGEGRRDQVNIRGFSALYDQYLDGFRDDSPYYRDLADIERIEVLRGPASVLYGRGSGGGLVNRISKKPRFGGDVGEVSLAAGSFDAFRGTFDIGRSPTDAFAWRFNAAAEDADGFRDHGHLERQLAAPSMAWRIGDGTLVAQAEFLRDRRMPDRGIPGLGGRPAPVDVATYYGDPARDHHDNDSGEARLTWRSALGERWQLRASVVGHAVDGDFYNTYANAVSDDGRQVLRGQYNGRTTGRDGFGQVEALADFGNGAVRHTLLLGMEGGQQKRSALQWRGSAAAVALDHPDLSVGSTPSDTLSTDRDFIGNGIGVYVQDQLALGEHWKALVGGRWDRFGQALADHLDGSRLSRTDTTFSPRAGVVWQPDGTHSLYAAWSRSFQTSGDGFSLAANTADLSPEQSTLKEVGWKGDWHDGTVSASAALFEQTRDGLRTTDPADPTRLIQVGEQRSRGIELELGGRIGDRLDVRLGYTRLDAEILRSNDAQNGVPLQGNRPSNVPEQSASLWGTYALGHGFEAGLGVFAVGDRYSANDDLVRLPGYVRTDAMLRWRGGRHEIALNLRNLGDITWYETAHTTHQIMPGTPRALTLTWRMALQ